MRNELDTIPIRKSIYSGFYEKKLIDTKSESIYGIFYHSAMWITVICMVNLFEPIVIRFTSIFKYIC